MARECEDEDAKWLVALFPFGARLTREEAKRVFLVQGEDPRAMCFAALVCWSGAEEEIELIRRAARLGCAAAQARMVVMSEESDCFAWAEKAAAQRDREGLKELAFMSLEWLWVCYGQEEGVVVIQGSG